MISLSILSFLMSGLATISRAQTTTAIAQQATAQSMTLEDLRSKYVNTVTLRPDTRIPIAMTYISQFLTKTTPNIEISWTAPTWKVSVTNQQYIANLSQYPDLSEMISLLKQYTQTILKNHPIQINTTATDKIYTQEIEKNISKFFPKYLMDALKIIDTLWVEGKHNADLLSYATKALCLLSFQHLNLLELSELLEGQALAMQVITQILTQQSNAREELLLAMNLGYHQYVHKNITFIKDENDPIRLFFENKNETLRTLAVEPNASIELKYLALIGTANESTFEDQTWEKWMVRFFSNEDEHAVLPLLQAGLKRNRFFINRYYSQSLNHFIHYTLSNEATHSGHLADIVDHKLLLAKKKFHIWSLKATALFASVFYRKKPEKQAQLINSINQIFDTSHETLIVKFEKKLRSVQSLYTGPFLDQRIIASYYHNLFYSSLAKEGLHCLEDLGSIPCSEKFLKSLGTPIEPIAAQFRQWFATLLMFQKGKHDNLNPLLSDLAHLPLLGTRPLLKTFYTFTNLWPESNRLTLEAVQALAIRMDTRIEHRHLLSEIAHSQLKNISLFISLRSSYVHGSYTAYSEDTIHYATYTKNWPTLLAAANNNKNSFHLRIQCLTALKKGGAISNEEFIKKIYSLTVADRDNIYTRMIYVNILNEQKEYSRSIDELKAWLKTHDESYGMEYLWAKQELAKALYKLKKYDDAWKVIEGDIPSMKAGVLEIAARTLSKLGKKNEAEKLAKILLDRYGNILSYSVVASIYWNHDKYDEAANFLSLAEKQTAGMAPLDEWQTLIGPAFSEVFKDKKIEQALQAFESLQKIKISPHYLLRLAMAADMDGMHELAFKISSTLKVNDAPHVEFVVYSYKFLSAWKGATEAIKWVTSNTKINDLKDFAITFYREREYDVLWNAFSDDSMADTSDKTEFIWLLRTASILQLKLFINASSLEKSAEWIVLKQHYNKSPYSLYHTLGKALLNLINDQEVFNFMKSEKDLSEIAYFFGLRDESKQQYQEAFEWYYVSTMAESNLQNIIKANNTNCSVLSAFARDAYLGLDVKLNLLSPHDVLKANRKIAATKSI